MIIIESLNHVALSVSDLEKSARFYKDHFDFDQIDRLSTPGSAFMRMGDIMIALYEVEGYRASDESESRISFYVDEQDFDDAVDELENAGIEIVYGPENIRNGQTLVFLDPDGNKIELSYPRLS